MLLEDRSMYHSTAFVQGLHHVLASMPQYDHGGLQNVKPPSLGNGCGRESAGELGRRCFQLPTVYVSS